jgi:hypothetical protein
MMETTEAKSRILAVLRPALPAGWAIEEDAHDVRIYGGDAWWMRGAFVLGSAPEGRIGLIWGVSGPNEHIAMHDVGGDDWPERIADEMAERLGWGGR